MRVLDLAAFKISVNSAAPPAKLTVPLQALWWAAKGHWERAHKVVQDEESTEAAWVHAYLHRGEGDLPNARYWYRQAGRAAFAGPLEQEWDAIAAALLRS